MPYNAPSTLLHSVEGEGGWGGGAGMEATAEISKVRCPSELDSSHQGREPCLFPCTVCFRGCWGIVTRASCTLGRHSIVGLFPLAYRPFFETFNRGI